MNPEKIRFLSWWLGAAVFLAGCGPGSGGSSSGDAGAGPAAGPAAAGTLVYISLPAADAIERIDPARGVVLDHHIVGKLPHNIVLTPDGKSAYCVLVGSQAVVEMDMASGAPVRTFLTEPVPEKRADGSIIQGHIDRNAFSQTTCFGCHRGGAGGVPPSVIGTRPFDLVLSEDGKEMFVTNLRSGNLSRIDIASGSILSLTYLEPSADALEPTGIALLDGILFVSILPKLPSLSPGVIRRLHAATLAVISDTETGPNTSVLQADAERKLIYVNHFETNTVSRLDAAGAWMDTLTVGDGPLGFCLHSGPALEGRLLVANYYANSLSDVSLADGRTEVLPLKFEGESFVNPTHLAADADAGIAYLVSSGTSGNLVSIRMADFKIQGYMAIGGLPYDVLVVPDPGP